MITCLLILIVMVILKTPSDWIRNASSDTQLIMFSLCVISDIHILIRCFSGGRKRGKEDGSI